MPLRLLELTVPKSEAESAVESLDEHGALQVWQIESGGNEVLVRVLLDIGDTEKLSDIFTRQFGSNDNFRLVLLPVEATLPAAEEAESEESQDEEKADDKVGQKRISREELHQDLSEASRLTGVYVVMIALSTVVAAVGLIRGDLAIIIGAMLIAPLLGPNIALSLAATLGDGKLARRSFKAIAAGVVIAAMVSVLIGLVMDVDPTLPEIASRTRPGMGDIVLALAAGAAGSLAFTSGVPAVVVGVMVAVALLPPLVVAGLMLGSGNFAPGGRSLVLALTNVTCINLAAVFTFLAQKVRPRTWWEADRARKATRFAIVTWIGMILVLLGVMLLWRIDWFE